MANDQAIWRVHV